MTAYCKDLWCLGKNIYVGSNYQCKDNELDYTTYPEVGFLIFHVFISSST